MKAASFLFEFFEASVQAKDTAYRILKIPVSSNSSAATFPVVGLIDNKESKE